MEWVKTTAKTLPEAIDLALDNLGVDESEAEIEIIEEPKSTLFGLRTKGVARVQARVKPRSIRPKQTRDRKNPKRKGNKGGNRRPNGSSNAQGKGSSSKDGNNRSNGNRNKSGGNQRSGDQSKGAKQGGGQSNKNQQAPSVTGEDLTSNKQKTDEGVSNRNRNQRRNKDAAQAALGGAAVGTVKKPTNKNHNNKDKASAKQAQEEETPVEEVATHLEEFLGGLTEAFGLEGDVVIDDSEDNTLIATVQGQHGLMVGPKGRTLDAIQELARISSQRTAPSSVRIKVDVGGYRAKRNEALAGFARKAADKAVDNGAEVALEPMTPADRKVVHDALNEDNRVETRSVGQEPRRKVIVVPVAGAQASDDEE